LLRAFRGVKRMSQYASSYLSSCPSIQPLQSAASIASALVTLAMPEPAFASLTHSPDAPAGCASSQSSKAARSSKAIMGRPARSSVMRLF
jgi:hypothetical protein